MKSKIYDSIDGAAACFRRLNGTHQFGCSSSRLGNVGVVHVIEDEENLKWLLKNGEADPYMVVLQPDMFTRDILVSLKKSGLVNGIVLLNNESSPHPPSFSHEDTCPNRYSGLSSFNNQTCESPWNPEGTQIMLMDWDFPIFYVSSETAVNKLIKCYKDFNSNQRNQRHDRSLCALEMSSFMFATVNSATCIRRSNMITNFNPMKFCDPLGDRNIWSTLFPRNKSSEIKEANQSVIVVATRLDTMSMFDGVTPGAVTPTTGIVALLATAQALSKMLPRNSTYSNNVMFTLLTGESYDYIGSSRMLWEMSQGTFPGPLDPAVADQPPLLQPQHLGLFVELSHLTNNYKNGTLVFHQGASMNKVESHIQVSTFTDEMKEVSAEFNLKFETHKGQLPPASLQTFVAHDKDLSGVVIADYKHKYSTNYYHSIFDDKKDVDYIYQNGSEPSVDSIQAFVSNFSTTLARALYHTVTGEKYEGNITSDIYMVDELFHCYLDKVNCSVFQTASYKQNLIEKPVTLYVGVNTWQGQNQITMLTGQTLAYLTGQVVNRTEKECHSNALHQVFQYLWLNGNKTLNESGICIETTMNYSSATSPAFEIPDYDWTSGQYSTWTESVWPELSVRIFLKPSRYHEDVIFSAGAVVLILSFIILYFLNSRSHILFGNTLSTGAC